MSFLTTPKADDTIKPNLYLKVKSFFEIPAVTAEQSAANCPRIQLKRAVTVNLSIKDVQKILPEARFMRKDPLSAACCSPLLQII